MEKEDQALEHLEQTKTDRIDEAAALVSQALSHWDGIRWPEDKPAIKQLQRALELLQSLR